MLERSGITVSGAAVLSGWEGAAPASVSGTAAVAAAGEGAAEVPAFAPLYAVYAPVKREPATATLIPYFAWANRGENEMTVWLRG